jgi:hypothetical protein
MPDTSDKDDRQPNKTTCGDADGSVAGNAGDVGRGLADAATDIAGLGTGLLGGLAGALDGLVGGLAGDRASTRRTKIHPWELPPGTEDEDAPDEASNEPDEYDEDYDRIH